MKQTDTWLRLFDHFGQLLSIESEAERHRMEVERQRADTAEAEVVRLRAELARLQKP